MKRVFINGFGSIGRRIAYFVGEDPQIEVIGVAKYSPDEGMAEAASRGLDVYVPESKTGDFAGYNIAGTIESAIKASDLIIDASPGGCGYDNKERLYVPQKKPAIYQGGETIYGERAVSDILFNSRANYDDAIGKEHVVQGSCNVTGMGRILRPLKERYGQKITRFDLTLIRRWADIEQRGSEVTDTIEMTQRPHHGQDAKSYMGKDTPLFLRAIKVPSRQMHLHIMDVRFEGEAPNPDEIHALFAGEAGVATIYTAKGTRDVRQFADSMGFGFGDTNLIHIHANMTVTIDDTVQMMYSDDQTGIVIPENHMLMQAILFGRPHAEAAAHTESLFQMGKKKSMLEAHFKL